MPHEIHPDRNSPDARSTLDAIRRLQADRAHRDARRTFFVEGVRNVVHAIESGSHIETLVYSEKLLIVPIARRLVRDRCRSGTPALHVSPEAFRQVSTTPRASGVGAVVAQRWSPLLIGADAFTKNRLVHGAHGGSLRRRARGCREQEECDRGVGGMAPGQHDRGPFKSSGGNHVDGGGSGSDDQR
jgi:hypothetical protein